MAMRFRQVFITGVCVGSIVACATSVPPSATSEVAPAVVPSSAPAKPVETPVPSAAAPTVAVPSPTPAPVVPPKVATPAPAAAPAPKAPPVTAAPAPKIQPAAPVAAAPSPAVVTPKDPRTFIVTAVPKSQAHPYFNVGHNTGFAVNGQPGKSVVMTRGETYTFDVNTGMQHDFYLTTSSVGRGVGTFTQGVEGQFTYQGQVTVKPTATTPDVLFYECRNHKYMGGKIYVVNKGEAPKVDDKPVIVDDGGGMPTAKVTDAQVKQKIAYAEMLAMSSESSKRVAASNNQQAKTLLDQAKTQIQQAKTTLGQGDATKALALADEGLRAVNSAAQLVPTESAATDHKAKYDELLKEVKGYAASYEKNVKAGQGKQAAATLDKAKFDGLVKDAEGLAGKGDYEAAAKQMTHASTMITAVLSLMLEKATVVYEKNFATPKEEYEYELARYESYRDLVPVAIEQRQPPETQKAALEELAKKAERIVSEGKNFAGRGDYVTAIQAMQAATENVQRGLNMIGVN